MNQIVSKYWHSVYWAQLDTFYLVNKSLSCCSDKPLLCYRKSIVNLLSPQSVYKKETLKLNQKCTWIIIALFRVSCQSNANFAKIFFILLAWQFVPLNHDFSSLQKKYLFLPHFSESKKRGKSTSTTKSCSTVVIAPVVIGREGKGCNLAPLPLYGKELLLPYMAISEKF